MWTNQLTSSLSVSYNDKRGNDKNTYDGVDLNGPQIEIHQDAFAERGVPTGTGALARLNTPDSISLSDSHIWLIRGDLTYYKQGWGGGHEFRTGIWAAPSMVRETVTEQVNGGFGLQRDRFIDPNNPAAGTTPFYLRTRTPAIAPAISEHDRDIAFYAQDSWTPTPRLTANVGLRVDFIKRHDKILGIDRQKSTAVQPRAGVSYLITEDARNVIRASYGRLYEQVNGRDYIVTFGQTTGAVDQTETYIDKLGNRTSVFTPAHAQRRPQRCSSTRTCTSRSSTSSRSATTGSSPGRSASASPPRSAASRQLRRGRHQRHLPDRAGPAVHRLRQGRSEPRHHHPGDQQHLDAR